jgi:hypothetical protein
MAAAGQLAVGVEDRSPNRQTAFSQTDARLFQRNLQHHRGCAKHGIGVGSVHGPFRIPRLPAAQTAEKTLSDVECGRMFPPINPASML